MNKLAVLFLSLIVSTFVRPCLGAEDREHRLPRMMQWASPLLPEKVDVSAPVSNTVMIELASVFIGRSDYVPGITWDKAISQHVSLLANGELHLSSGNAISGDQHILSSSDYVRVGFGGRYWPYRTDRLKGFFTGMRIDKTISLSYVQVSSSNASSKGPTSGLHIDQTLNLNVELGGQWLNRTGHAMSAGVSANYGESQTLTGIFNFRYGWGW